MKKLPVNWKQHPLLSFQIRLSEWRINRASAKIDAIFEANGITPKRKTDKLKKEIDRIFGITPEMRGKL